VQAPAKACGYSCKRLKSFFLSPSTQPSPPAGGEGIIRKKFLANHIKSFGRGCAVRPITSGWRRARRSTPAKIIDKTGN
jgi:hypothetical protein